MAITKSQVGSYELKTHSSEILKLVESGETVTVTRHGKPIAQIIPVSDSSVKRREAVEGLLALSQSFKKRGGSISHDEIKSWINSGRP
jgi:prevent-host-death family protein